MLESSYNYVAQQGETNQCQYERSLSVGSISSYKFVRPTELKAALLKGPVSASIKADSFSFHFYHTGILPDQDCNAVPDHTVLIVGYG